MFIFVDLMSFDAEKSGSIPNNKNGDFVLKKTPIL
jgi:hypothetical protein